MPQNTPFAPSGEYIKELNEKLTKADLIALHSETETSYNELSELSKKINRFSEHSIDDVTKKIQDVTNQLYSLTDDTGKGTLLSAKRLILVVKEEVVCKLEAAKTQASRPRI